MTTREVQKAITAYNKTGDSLALSRMLRRLVLYMAENAKIGFSVRFLNNLDCIEPLLRSLAIKAKRSK